MLLISRCTSKAFQVELMAIFPVNPASVKRALVSPRGMAMSLVMSSAGGRQTTFLVWTLVFGVAWRLFLLGGGTPLEKEDGNGKRFYQKKKKEYTTVQNTSNT